jgi:SAM-dependent methyltransferase
LTEQYDEWAKVYDMIYGNYKDDIEFYKEEAKKSKGEVLEVACGTGRIYLELLREGIDAVGIDISDEMISALVKKAHDRKLTPEVHVADMRNFRLDKKFSLIIVPFRSFLFNLTTDDQLEALLRFKAHLLPGGRLILNFFYPDLERMMSFGKESEEITVIENGKYLLREKSFFVEEVNQLIETDAALYKGNNLFWKGSYNMAFIHKREFELLLRLAGFTKCEVYGGFDGRPLTSFKQEMVWVAENS